MSFSPILTELFERLCCLPGVGPRSAQRMAFHLLQRNRDGANDLADVLKRASEEIGNCARCRTLTELDICSICSDVKRDKELLCVVENPADVMAVEQSGYRGYYFVLLGRLSPIEGMGVAEIGFERLCERLQSGVRELIIATSATVEGDATAAYLHQELQGDDLRITRIAYGVPLGGELDYVDQGTLSHALEQRRQISSVE